jgi:hypothetical protein
MAGDIAVAESIIVRESGELDEVGFNVAGVGGRVLHRYGPKVMITDVPEDATQALRALSGVATASTSDALDAMAVPDLDETGAFGLAAFKLRNSAEFIEAKTRRPLASEQWDSGAALAPDAPGTGAAAGDEAEAPTSARMVGTVAVGVIIVEGSTADLQFSSSEEVQVVAEVQNGLTFLATQSAGGVTWSYDIRVVSINATPAPDTASFGEKEERWRNPTMAALGFSADWAGVSAYVEDLRNRLGTDWAYVAFFVKYPLGHFAYASIGGPRLVMQHANDGWGPDNIDRVFAHETGHIFGAPDEYASSNCNCGGSWGFFGTPNSNCALCASGGGVACIMKSNDWSMCSATPAHFGWDFNFTVQYNWRWCRKCQGMAFGGNPSSVCPAGGSHDHSGSGNYALVHNSPPPAVQANWRWCRKCQGLAFAGNPGSVCPAGGAHDHTGSGNYSLLHNVPGRAGQRDWRWCRKCQGLAFAGNPGSRCPAGGAHDHAGSGNYTLLHNTANPSGQDNWRWCRKCQALAFAGNPGSRCPTGGAHDHTGSGNYTLLHNLPLPSEQNNWRWCRKCQGLGFAGNPGSRCPAGGAHDHSGSGNYTLLHGVGIDQANWRWCRKCQGLAFAGNPGSRCPAGGAHDHSGSGNYSMLSV